MANLELGRNDCCGSGAPGACDVYGHLNTSLDRVQHYDRCQAKPATIQQVMAEITAHRPLCLRVVWDTKGAHYLAISGFQQAPVPGPKQYVRVQDPLYGSSDLTYSELTTRYLKDHTGKWKNTFWTRL